MYSTENPDVALAYADHLDTLESEALAGTRRAEYDAEAGKSRVEIEWVTDLDAAEEGAF